MPDVFNASNLNRPSVPLDDTIFNKIHKKGRHEHEWDKHSLSAFRYYPEHATFANIDPEEEIILLLRKHIFTNVSWFLTLVAMLFAPLILKFFPLLSFLPDNFQLIAIILYYLIVVAYGFEQFLSWFFNVAIITDERIVDVNFHNLIYREITEANLDQIQDVTVTVGSVLRTMFDYGNVSVQTASEVQKINFMAVPHPDRVAKILRELRVEEEREKIEGRVN